MVQSGADAIKAIGQAAPPPAQPVSRQLDHVADTVTGACRRLPACP